MLRLERRADEVYYNGRKLIIVKQAQKGPNHEVIKVEGLPEACGQKWLSLTKLKEGINEIDCQGKSPVVANEKYQLTQVEAEEVRACRARIEEIITEAKKRYVPIPDLKVNPAELTEAEKQAKIEELKKFLGM